MSLVVPDVGEVYIMNSWLAGFPPSSLFVRLYQNNFTPDQNTLLSDLTVATFSGYAQASVTLGTFTTVAHKAKSVGTAAQVFTHNGGGTSNTIYGYYVVDTFTGNLVWVERFGSSQIMLNNGDQISITLQFTANSEF
jgi:hypothetical protein